jgi:thiol-disulfide isomerase/thioredoxin
MKASRRGEKSKDKARVEIHVWGAKWCGPCKELKKVLKLVAETTPVHYYDIDLKAEDGLAETLIHEKIEVVPTIAFMVGIHVKQIVRGGMSLSSVLDTVKLLNRNFKKATKKSGR